MSTSSSSMMNEAPAADKWESEDEFEARLNRIQSKVVNGEMRPASTGDIQLDTEEMAKLKSEVCQLKQVAEEARRRVTQLEQEAARVIKRDQDNEKMLEEKVEHIRELEKLVAEFQSKQSSGVSEEELITLHGELERERQQQEEDRQSMEAQFRHLELMMARERAEIARERNELQRTKTELKHKLDSLDKTTQSDMSPLRRLRDELRNDQSPLLAPPGAAKANPMPLPHLPAINRKAPESEDAQKRSGILSRFLGRKDE